jgi:pimeloyl-ACP methyl ester carboxylesterase
VSTWEPLERDYVVVQWDQRGGGRTLARAGTADQTTSLEQLTLDGVELARYLRGYLRTDSVVLVGHSWGSFLGVYLVKRQPQLFKALVGTGQVTTWRSMVEAQHAYALSRARAESNTAAVAELESQGVPVSDNFDQYLVMRRWLNRYLAPPDRQWISKQEALVQSALGSADFEAYRQGFRSMSGLSATVFAMDVLSLGVDFRIPFFLIQGRDDHIASTRLASSYFAKITAPVKRMTLIEGAGHFAPMTHMAQFAAALREHLRQLPRER